MRMRHRNTIAGIGALLALGALAACFSDRDGLVDTNGTAECPALALSEVAGAVVVPIRGFSFEPDTVRVQAGTRVAWVNCEDEGTDAHTTTSDDGLWDSPLLTRGETFSRTFDEPGEFGYFCDPHPFMRGVVIVE